MTRSIGYVVSLAASLALAYSAAAQNPQPAPPHETHTQVAPPNASQPPPEQIAPGGSATETGKGSLSDRLARQEGTLRPPTTVDPGIHAPMPPNATGTMPVIPPPGTPGGQQNVVPK